MYLEWAKKNRWIILCFHALLLITTIIVGGLHVNLFPNFLFSALFFWILQYFKFKSLANEVYITGMLILLGLDILILGAFVLFFLNDGPNRLSMYIFLWAAIPIRTQMVFLCKRFNISGTEV